MVLEDGYRLNVGIIVMNDAHSLLLAQRNGGNGGWQFPQGGMRAGETPEQAMYRELQEELGLRAQDVTVIAESRDWYTYDLPEKFQRKHIQPLCIGQRQKWFLLKLTADESAIDLSNADGEYAEFVDWRWSDWEEPLQRVIDFKRAVYQQVLMEFRQVVANG